MGGFNSVDTQQSFNTKKRLKMGKQVLKDDGTASKEMCTLNPNGSVVPVNDEAVDPDISIVICFKCMYFVSDMIHWIVSAVLVEEELTMGCEAHLSHSFLTFKRSSSHRKPSLSFLMLAEMESSLIQNLLTSFTGWTSPSTFEVKIPRAFAHKVALCRRSGGLQ